MIWTIWRRMIDVQIRNKRRWRFRRGGCEGQSLVEFALVTMLFFLLLFGLIDFGRLFFTQMTLENAVRQAGRFAVTGNHLPDPNNPSQNLSRVASIMQVAQQQAVGLGISNIQISSLGGGSTGPGRAGGPGDTETITLTTNLHLITPLIGHFFPKGVYTFTVSVTFKNEPFSPSATS